MPRDIQTEVGLRGGVFFVVGQGHRFDDDAFGKLSYCDGRNGENPAECNDTKSAERSPIALRPPAR